MRSCEVALAAGLGAGTVDGECMTVCDAATHGRGRQTLAWAHFAVNHTKHPSNNLGNQIVEKKKKQATVGEDDGSRNEEDC